MSAADMESIYVKCAPFTASYDQHSILGGIHVQGDGQTLRLCGTDGSRLSSDTRSSDLVLDKILPAVTMLKLAKVAKLAAFDVLTSDQHVRFIYNNMQVTVRPIAGEYPRYRELFPKESKAYLIFNQKQLLAAVKAATAAADDRTNLIKIELGAEARITSHTPDGPSFDGSVSFKGYDFETPETVAVNGHYMMQLLEATEGDVLLAYTAPLKPLIFSLSSTAKHLLMPVQAK